MTCLPVYLLVRPLLEGRRVLELGQPAGGLELLQQSGASEVAVWRPTPGSPMQLGEEWDRLLDSEPGGFQAVMALELLEQLSPEERGRCVAGLARLLGPGGLAVIAVRNPAAQLIGDAGPGGAPLDYWGFAGLIREHFANVVIVGQSPMRGFYLSELEAASAARELALDDGLVRSPEEASHFVALAAPGDLPALQPYLLVTLPYYPLAEEVGTREAQLREELSRARAELEQLSTTLRGREEELFRLTGRAARVERLEAEARQARDGAELEEARDELQRLRQEVARQSEIAVGLKRELDDARLAGEDLRELAREAQHAATDLALERDQRSQRHEGLVAGHRELAGEFERLKIQKLESDASLDAGRRENLELLSRLDEARTQAGQGRRDAQELREQLALVEHERDRLRECLLALEEKEERRETARRAAGAAVAELEGRLSSLQVEASAAQLRSTALQAQVAQLEQEVAAGQSRDEELARVRLRLADLEARLTEAEQRAAGSEQARAEMVAALEQRGHALEQVRAGRDHLQGELEAAEQRISDQLGELQRTRQALEDTERQLRADEQTIRTLRLEQTERDRLIECFEETVRGRDASLQSAGEERDAREVRIRELEEDALRAAEQLDSRRRELEDARARLGESLVRVAALEGDLDEAQTRLQTESQRRAELEEQGRRSLELSQANEALRSQLAEEDRRRADLQAELGRAWQRGMEAKQLADDLSTELDQLRWAAQVDGQSLIDARARAQAAEDRLGGLERDLRNARQELHQRESSLADLEGEGRARLEAFQTLEAERDQLVLALEEQGAGAQRQEALLRSTAEELEELRRRAGDEEARRARERDALETELRGANQALALERARAEALEGELQGQRAQAARLSEECERSAAGLQDVRTRLEGHERLHSLELGNLQQQLQAQREERARLEAEVRAGKKRIEEQQLRLNEARQAIDDSERRVRAAADERVALERRQSATGQALAEARRRIDELTGLLDTVRPQLAAAEQRLCAKESEQGSLEREAATLRAQVQQLEPRLVEARRQVADARRDLERARHELARLHSAAGPPKRPPAPPPPPLAAPRTGPVLPRSTRSPVRPPSNLLEPLPAGPNEADEWRQDAPTRPSLRSEERLPATAAGRPSLPREPVAPTHQDEATDPSGIMHDLLDSTVREEHTQPSAPPPPDDEAISAAADLIDALVSETDEDKE